MAKDDFHVLVYQILAYLYQCLKSGEAVNPKQISIESDFFKFNSQEINPRYWAYIIHNLCRLELIDGVVFAKIDSLPYPHPINLDNCMITPAGIEYLTDNAFVAKAKDFLKDVKAIAPFI